MLDEVLDTKLLESKLQEEKTVSKCTNFRRLRKKHLCNQVCEDEDNSFCTEFERSLVSNYLGDDDQVSQMNEVEISESVDCLRILYKVLNGHLRKRASVQNSIVQQELKDAEVGRNSFLGTLSKGHVRHLECGSDTALIIPYLNKVLLRLDNKRWLRDADVSILVPFEHVGNFSEVRRADNILMAYDVPDGEPADVNKDALRIELYSARVRTCILSTIKLKTKTSARGLDVTAQIENGVDSFLDS